MCRVEGGHPAGPLITRWAGPRRIYLWGDVSTLIAHEGHTVIPGRSFSRMETQRLLASFSWGS